MTQEYRLISSDGHLEVPPERWTPRVPRKYQDRVPRTAPARLGSGYKSRIWTVWMPRSRQRSATGSGPEMPLSFLPYSSPETSVGAGARVVCESQSSIVRFEYIWGRQNL